MQGAASRYAEEHAKCNQRRLSESSTVKTRRVTSPAGRTHNNKHWRFINKLQTTSWCQKQTGRKLGEMSLHLAETNRGESVRREQAE
jgi:hypothetical protein